MFRGCLAPFLLPWNVSITQFVHYFCNLKLPRNERKAIHIFVPNDMTHFQWPPISLRGIPWRPKLGSRESSKACIIIFNFGCFWDIILRVRSYFSPETFQGMPTWVVTLCGCLTPFSLPRKACKYPIVSFFCNLKLSRNESKAIHIFVAKDMNHFECPLMFLGGLLWRPELVSWENPKACIITFNFDCSWDIFEFFSESAHIFLPKRS